MIAEVQDRPENTIHVEHANRGLKIFINCKEESIDDALARESEPDHFDVRVYQNMLDGALLSNGLELNLAKTLNTSWKQDQRPEIVTQILEHAKTMNLDLSGELKVVKDPSIID